MVCIVVGEWWPGKAWLAITANVLHANLLGSIAIQEELDDVVRIEEVRVRKAAVGVELEHRERVLVHLTLFLQPHLVEVAARGGHNDPLEREGLPGVGLDLLLLENDLYRREPRPMRHRQGTLRLHGTGIQRTLPPHKARSAWSPQKP